MSDPKTTRHHADRRTAGKDALGRVILGDDRVAKILADALAARDPVERFTHGFHTWPAGLHPDATRELILGFPGGSVADPFCGGGTVLVEAAAAGRTTFGRDLSGIAVRIARARTSVADEAVLTKMRSTARRLAEQARMSHDQPPDAIFRAVQDWYAPYVLSELECLRKGVMAAEGPERPLLEVVFSSILIKTSWRKSDTSNQREKHDRPAGTAAILFHKKARELGRRIAELRDAVPAGTAPVDVQRGDARRLSLPKRVDLVLTSPPYPSTYDYLPLQHLRRVWLAENEDDAAEIGARRAWREGGQGALTAWKTDTRTWMRAAGENLAPGGHLVVVIGDGLAPSGPIDTSAATEEAGKAAGLRSVARASLERPDAGRETTRWEHVFAFQK